MTNKMKIYTKLIILFIFGLIYYQCSGDFCEKEGQFQFQSSCYTINTHMEWIDAIMECRFINAEFAIIDSIDEFNHIKNELKKIIKNDSPYNNSFYIGAEDQLRRGFLKWFRTEIKVPDNFLCASTLKEFNTTGQRMKLCAVFDQNLQCIDGRNCTVHLPVICETNCSKTIFTKTRLCLDRELSKNKTTTLTTTRTTTTISTTLSVSSTITTTTTVPKTTPTTPKTSLTTKLISTTEIFKDKSCDKNLCENDSTCIPLSEIGYFKNTNETYICDCKVGFNGIYCEKDLRPCSNYVCINNSTCESPLENPMDFKCICQLNFEGLFCERNTICDNVTCLNGGNCFVDNLNFNCMCTTYFSGTYCELKDSELVVLENVSASISVVGIIAITVWALFILLMDISRYMFKIEPEDLHKQRELIKKKMIHKRIKLRINRLMQRYRKIESENEKKLEKQRKLMQKNKEKSKIKRDFTHFSVRDIKFIDDDDDEQIIEIEKLKLLNSNISQNKN